MANRLNLDFTIDSAAARKEFLEEYLRDQQFVAKPLTETELDTCAKYLLYGKDEDGLSCVQRKEVQVDTKNKTWTKERYNISLEGLLDSEDPSTSNYEDILLQPHQTHYKNIKETFSREKALQKAPEALIPTFKELFETIDKTELLINYYEIYNGKREKEPRNELLKRLRAEVIEECKQKAKNLTQYQYLKKKHNLVELRREQFTLRDSYQSTIQINQQNRGAPIMEEKVVTFDSDLEVFPLGLYTGGKVSCSIFQPFEQLYPENFTEEEIKKIISLYWKKARQKKEKIYFDFTELEHVYELISAYEELRAVVEHGQDNESTTAELLNTLRFYEEQANLTEIQKEILTFKKASWKNKQIAEYINNKYKTTYNENYISTIFRQKIIKQINECARFHSEIISNLSFPEEFKQCICCKKHYLICSNNFVKKTRSKDGYTNRCKACDKLYR